jgi:hypothetical protein
MTGIAELKKIMDERIFEGLRFEIKETLEPGDVYLAARNTGPHLLTVEKIVYDVGAPFVIPVENAYAFDLAECVAIKFLSCAMCGDPLSVDDEFSYHEACAH